MSEELSRFLQLRADKQDVGFNTFLDEPGHADTVIARSRKPKSNRPTFNPETALGEQDPNLNRGPIGFIEQDPAGFAKGVASAPFTAAPDLLSLGAEGMNFLSRSVGGALGIPTTTFEGSPGGNPIREAIGLNPESGPGIAGEVVSPVGTMAKALGVTAKAVVAGAKLAAGTGFDPSLAMTLFHGTPHRFNKFDMSKIGTGEGAQAFGHGLYFAENPGVAGSYQDALSGTIVVNTQKAPSNRVNNFVADYIDDSGGVTPEALSKLKGEAALEADRIVIYHGGGKIKQAKSFDREVEAGWYSIRSDGKGVTGPYQSEYAAGNVNVLDFEDVKAIDELTVDDISVSKGHLYEVDIPDSTIDKMLDWDAPLSEQPEIVAAMPESVQRRIRQMQGGFGDDKVTGQILHDTIIADEIGAGGFAASPEQSAFLRDAGIPGIRYFDGGSRGNTVIDARLQKAVRNAGGDIEAGLDEFMRGVHNTPARKAEIRQDFLDKLNSQTRNIVVFNPDDIRQVKRDGEVVFQK